MSRIYQQPSANSSLNKHQTSISTSTSSSQSSSTSVSPSVSSNNVHNLSNNISNHIRNLNPTTINANSTTAKIYVNNPANSSLVNTPSLSQNKDDKKIEQTQIETKMASDLEKLINRLETVTKRLETASNDAPKNVPQVNHAKPAPVAQQADTTEDLPPIVAFDELINTTFNSFKELSAKLGVDVKTIVDLVEKVFRYERKFLVEAARSLKPAQVITITEFFKYLRKTLCYNLSKKKDVWVQFLQQFSKNIEELQSFREKNRQSQFFNHLSAISESIGALGWIAVAPAPSPYVKEMSDSAQFYTNRVLKDYKEKDPNHVNWVKLWLQTLSELQAYVKQYHTTGVSWNSSKKSAQFDPSSVSSSASTGGPKAPTLLPPPPPPAPNFNELFADDLKSIAARSAGPSSEALFAELNKGSDITRHLKQVSDDQKTHKNPNLRAGHLVPSGSVSASSSAVSLQSKTSNISQKPPVFELQDKKWKVEYLTNRHDLVIDDTDLKQTVYIYQCKECTITVKGKINSISIDSCQRVGLVFDDVLSTVEFINSKNVQMQVVGRVPTVAIEKTDGCQVYLSNNSLDTEIVSSKSSSMNILVPNETGDDFFEYPVPEQYKTVINKSRKLVTTPSEAV